MAGMLRSTIINPKNCSYEGKDSNEEILYVFRRAFITNIPWFIGGLIMIVFPQILAALLASTNVDAFKTIPISFLVTANLFWYVVTFGYFFQNFLNWYFNVYIITSKKVVDVDFVGVLYKNISEAAITDVEDVTSTIAGALRMIFNFGSVFIQTAGERREFEFTDVSNPSKVRDIISDLVADKKGGRKLHIQDD